MAPTTKRYVRSRVSSDTFIKGVGVVPGSWEGELDDSDAVSHLVGAGVLADATPPREGAPSTPKQEAAAEAERLGIDFGEYDSVTEAEIRALIADHNNPKEGGA